MLDRFAKLLGIRHDQAEDALHSERAAKHVVSRRAFFGAGAALATGAIFSFPGQSVSYEETRFRLVSGDYYGSAVIGERVITASRGFVTKVDHLRGVITIGEGPGVGIAGGDYLFKAGERIRMSGRT